LRRWESNQRCDADVGRTRDDKAVSSRCDLVEKEGTWRGVSEKKGSISQKRRIQLKVTVVAGRANRSRLGAPGGSKKQKGGEAGGTGIGDARSGRGRRLIEDRERTQNYAGSTTRRRGKYKIDCKKGDPYLSFSEGESDARTSWNEGRDDETTKRVLYQKHRVFRGDESGLPERKIGRGMSRGRGGGCNYVLGLCVKNHRRPRKS